jgi:rare lipoprotein A
MKRIVIIPVLLFTSIISLSSPSILQAAKLNIKSKVKPKSKLPLVGKASFYSNKYTGKRTANAEVYNPNLFTAAHESLPIGTMVKVTNLTNHASAIVKINDRCACSKHGRIIDLSMNAAEQLKMIDKGVARVRIELVN